YAARRRAFPRRRAPADPRLSRQPPGISTSLALAARKHASRGRSAAPFSWLTLRCRTQIDWLYTGYGFKSSADCPGRPRAVAVAIFRSVDGGAGGTLIVRPYRRVCKQLPRFPLSKVT